VTAAATGSHPLDNPVWSALVGRQSHLGEVGPLAARFDPEVALFSAVSDDASPEAWAALAELVGADGIAVLFRAGPAPVPGWEEVARYDAVQMVGTAPELAEQTLVPAVRLDGGEHAGEIVKLGLDHVDEVLALVERTRPGPFRRRTLGMGRYVGIRAGGALVAMAGERLAPAGHTEVSAVCVDEAVRGQGLGATVVRVVTSGIAARGEVPFLHVEVGNEPARRLYASMGFDERRPLVAQVVRPRP